MIFTDMSRFIVGLMGKIGSGKDTVASYLCENHDFIMIGYGDLTRKIASERGLKHNRENLMSIVNEHIEKFGKDYFSKLMVAEIYNNINDRIVINGIRQISDAKELLDMFGNKMLLIHIDVSTNNRYVRMNKRMRPGDPESFEEFLRQDDEERTSFDTDETFKLANMTIENNENESSLFLEIDNVISNFLKNRNAHVV